VQECPFDRADGPVGVCYGTVDGNVGWSYLIFDFISSKRASTG
jgi:hypothetical protein